MTRSGAEGETAVRIVRAGVLTLALIVGFCAMVLIRSYHGASGAPDAPADRREMSRDISGRRSSPEQKVERVHRPTDKNGRRDTSAFRVLDLVTGDPVGEISVRLLSDDKDHDVQIAQTKGAEFSLYRGSEEDWSVEVEVSSEGYVSIRMSNAYLPGEGGDLYLVPGDSIVVRCLDTDSHSPVEGAVVTWDGAEERTFGSGVTDSEGLVEFDDVCLYVTTPFQSGSSPTFSLRFRASGASFLPGSGELLFRPDQVLNEITLLLTPAQTIDVQVSDMNTDVPVNGALVVHQWSYLSRSRLNANEVPIRTAQDGTASLPVRRGAWKLEMVVFHADYAMKGIVIRDVPSRLDRDDEGPEILVELEQCAELDGLVLSTDGEPVPDVTVSLIPVRRKRFNDWMRVAFGQHFGQLPDVVATDSHGTFSARNVALGEYRVSLYHPDLVEVPDNPLLRVDNDTEPWIGYVHRGREIHGEVLDGDAVPVAGALLEFVQRRNDGRVKEGYSRVIEADREGAFSVSGLVGRDYEVTIIKRGYRVVQTKIDPQTLPLPWQVLIERETRSADEGGARLSLSLRQDGSVIGEGRVRLVLHNPYNLERVKSSSAARTAGRADFGDLPVGIYHAIIRVDGYPPVVVENLELGGLGGGEPLSIELKSGSVVRLEVPGPALSGALRIEDRLRHLVVHESPLPHQSGAENREINLRLNAGVYEATFEPTSGENLSAAFEVVDGQRCAVRLESESPRLIDDTMRNGKVPRPVQE